MLSEFIEQELAVLIIGDECLLRDLVGSYYQKQGLKPILITCFQVDFFDNLETKISQNNFYKIILIHGFNQDYDDRSLKLIAWLKQQAVQTISLLRASTPLTSDSEIFAGLSQSQEKERLFLQKALFDPKNKVLIGQDVVTTEKYFSYPYKIGFLAKNNDYLINADFEIFPQTQSSFFKTIKKELIRPERKNFLIRGKTLFFGEFIHQFSLIYRQIYNKILPEIKLKIEPATALESVFSSYKLIVVVQSSDISDFIDFLVRDFPHFDLGIDPEF